jgi:hypothetical protein
VSPKAEYQTLVNIYPDAASLLKLLFKIIYNIEDLTNYTPDSVGESYKWTAIVSTAEENAANYCSLNGKSLQHLVWRMYSNAE